MDVSDLELGGATVWVRVVSGGSVVVLNRAASRVVATVVVATVVVATVVVATVVVATVVVATVVGTKRTWTSKYCILHNKTTVWRG